MTLMHLSSQVRSPHSPGGVANVKKWVWIARVWRGGDTNFAQGYNPQSNRSTTALHELGLGIGIGWQGEWILEGEGTREGKQVLLDCLRGANAGKQLWELVREKSGGGKIWLRFVLMRLTVPLLL
jgi:hypothetical protein